MAGQRHHRTTGKVVGEAWEEERGLEVPSLTVVTGCGPDPDQRWLEERVEGRDVAECEEAWG